MMTTSAAPWFAMCRLALASAVLGTAAAAQEPLAIPTAPALPDPPALECLSAFGQTVCGYDCQAAYGQVRCATWPGGACGAGYGQVACGPPPPPSWRWRWGSAPPRAACMVALGQVVCGYDCLAQAGVVRCAQTPDGSCTVAYGAVTCADPPPPPVLVALPTPSDALPPGMDCLSAFGTSACGWSCTAAFGKVACGDWPGAACIAALGGITCGPPLPAGADPRLTPPAECVQAFGQVACGWGCIAAHGQVACGQRPESRCAAVAGEVVCTP